MATSNFVLTKGYNAAAAITKFYAVKLSAAETVTPVTTNADVVHGFAQFGVTAAEILKGKGATVAIQGITEAVASAAIAVGAQVQLESDGRVSTVVGASGKRIVGRCVGHAATAANDRISLLINSNGGVA